MNDALIDSLAAVARVTANHSGADLAPGCRTVAEFALRDDLTAYPKKRNKR